jgi:trk system potassium uptake protein TrkH
MVRPRKVDTIYMDGKPLKDETIEFVSSYFIVYAMILIGCTILISIYNPMMPDLDVISSFTASLTCLSNVGPGLGLVGPADNFSSFSEFSKLVLTFEMIAGRLELFPILILFSPTTWRKRN